jgi:DNA repair protein RadD
MITLRDYQVDAVNAVRQSYVTNHKAPLLVLPTGAGKTVVFCHVGNSVQQRGKRVLMLVHRVELLRQTSNALNKSGVMHGLINPMFTPNMRLPVQVASVQTVVNRLDTLPPPDLIIIDEAHHANASTWRKIIDRFPESRQLGVTATPCRSDGSGLGIESGGLFDDLIVGPQVPDLIAMGHLVRPIIYAPKTGIDLDGVRIVRGDYDQAQVAAIVDVPKITGDAVDHYTRLAGGEPSVFFCVSIKHAQHVAEQLRASGYRAFSVDGNMDDQERKRILGGLATGAVQCVTSCDLISEGTDIPAISYVGALRPTKSTGLWIQQAGRGLRPAPGKDNCIIADHVGNTLQHGLIDERREWSLEGEPKKRRKGMAAEAIERVAQCVKCFAMHVPAPVCPFCGHVYEVKDEGPKQVDGQLQQLTAGDLDFIRKREKIDKAREVGMAAKYEDLVKIGKERGYKAGWARHTWLAKQAKMQGRA